MRTCDMIIEYCKSHPGQEFTVLDLSVNFGWEMDENIKHSLSRAVNNLVRSGWCAKCPYSHGGPHKTTYRRYLSTPRNTHLLAPGHTDGGSYHIPPPPDPSGMSEYPGDQKWVI